jgi:hypothetical protein
MAAAPEAGAPEGVQGVAKAEAGIALAAPGAQGAVMQRMLEAQAAARAMLELLMNQMWEQQKAAAAALVAAAAAQAKQEQMMGLQKAQQAEQDREMALLAQELQALGGNTNSDAAGPVGKKSSTCALQ